MSDFRAMNKPSGMQIPEPENIRVLLIEDNPGDARLVREMLVETGTNRFNLEHVDRISQGLTRLSQEDFQVILLDLSLPDGHGLDTIDRVCTLAPHVPILVLTGLDDESLAIKAVQEGAQDYLVKGQMNSNLLVRALRYGIERKRAEEALRSSEKEAKRLAEESAIVAEIGRTISSTLNIEEVYDRFTEGVRKLITFDRIAINLINFEENTFVVLYTAGVVVGGRQHGNVIPLAGSATEKVVGTRLPLFIQMENKDELARRYPGLLPSYYAGLRSMISIPLISKDQVIGTLYFQSNRPNAYTEMELRIAERVATQIAGAIANAQLFADHKRAEKELCANEQKYKTLIENLSQKIFLKDKNSVYISCNEKYAHDLKIKPDEISGRTDYDFYPKELAEKYRADDKRIIEAGKTEELEEKYIQNEQEMWVHTIKTPVRDEEGETKGILGIFWDITEQKKAQEKMVLLQEQLRQSQKMEAIGRLAGGIAHDFNNLLTVIKGYGQLSLIELKEGDPLRGNLEEIKGATDKASDLIRQLLAFSRHQILEFKVLDLNTVLRNLEKMLRRVIGEDIELVMHLPEDLGGVKTDPGQIEQVIMNLVVNAKDAMPSGGKLTIETGNVELDEAYARRHVAVAPGRYVMLSVSDTGVGMTPEVRDRVFEPFFTTKERGEGTGLGLSTVFGIVKQSGGNIWVYSEPGRGTTFKIYLPRVDEPLEEEEKKIFVKEGIPRGNETVLVVEDDEKVRSLAVQILEGQGYRVLEAPQGVDAFLISAEHEGPIHLLLTDVVMPKMSGRELADRIASIHPEIKVLYMSGYTDNAIIHHEILKKGMNFIQKPFTIDGLARKVREGLDK